MDRFEGHPDSTGNKTINSNLSLVMVSRMSVSLTRNDSSAAAVSPPRGDYAAFVPYTAECRQTRKSTSHIGTCVFALLIRRQYGPKSHGMLRSRSS